MSPGEFGFCCLISYRNSVPGTRMHFKVNGFEFDSHCLGFVAIHILILIVVNPVTTVEGELSGRASHDAFKAMERSGARPRAGPYA